MVAHAGALGGPFVIFALTPLRNALTLASQDQESSAFELYGRTFQSGFAAGDKRYSPETSELRHARVPSK
eukprot:260043-Amphidinium_carterae.1